ncbi:hypothetical protein [Citrobacter braakii]|nr:hypothetical protein [Citrobacter braakii]MDH1758404.1 hypothetical protein [Citrobacter braakii]MDH1856732.1 hypothetical protein [Citrobacter braakii]
MGCDIHMMVEVKRSINGEEKWVNYDHFRKTHGMEMTMANGNLNV